MLWGGLTGIRSQSMFGYNIYACIVNVGEVYKQLRCLHCLRYALPNMAQLFLEKNLANLSF